MAKLTIERLHSRLACTLVAAITVISLNSQSLPSRPKLVVGIVVEGLSEDYLSLLEPNLTDGGFKRLMDNGVVLTNVDYGGASLDATAATAIVMTGAAPATNGVPSTWVFDPETRRTANIFSSKDAGYAPTALLVSTIADELRIDAAGTGIVHSIAASPEQAIALAGHAASSAVWIDDITGKWTSTSFYRELPQAVGIRNLSKPLSIVLDTMSWTPMLDLKQYPDLPEHKRLYPFRHIFQRADKNRFKAFKVSPLGNDAVTSLATDYLTALPLGRREATDMLNLAYTLAPYPYGRDADTRTETLDSYLRLDRNIEQLLNSLDRTAGRDNFVVFLTSTPAPANSKRDDEKWNIPHGEFSARKAISLLNMYLTALHGNGDWVAGYHNGQFYLNHTLIKAQNIDLSTMRSEAAEFLGRMSGVSSVFTIDDIMAGRAGDHATALRRNTSLHHAGDLLITINPGWETIDDDFDTQNHHVAREGYTPGIAFILAPSLPHTEIDRRVDARALAPSLARLIRIRAPNGAGIAPLRLK